MITPPANDDDMPEQMHDGPALARAEALDMIEEHGAGNDPAAIERIANGLLRSLKSYDQGPAFRRLVLRELRLLARERRQGLA